MREKGKNFIYLILVLMELYQWREKTILVIPWKKEKLHVMSLNSMEHFPNSGSMKTY